jgi:hypothetical protein
MCHFDCCSNLAGRKVRFDGNSEELIELAKVNAMALGAGARQYRSCWGSTAALSSTSVACGSTVVA